MYINETSQNRQNCINSDTTYTMIVKMSSHKLEKMMKGTSSENVRLII